MDSAGLRAAEAERAVCGRGLRRLWALPGTRLGVVGYPASPSQRLFVRWDYWWQAQLLDCLVDAQLRERSGNRATDIAALTRGIRLRNGLRWCNDYYDDIAWLGLAMHRATAGAGVAVPGASHALGSIAERLRSGWTDHGGGGIWWRRRDDYKNVPANGPAAILFARLHTTRADVVRARSIVEWMTDHLVDERTGIVYDGLHVDRDGSVREVERAVYTYCHGVYLGACVELAVGHGDRRWASAASATVAVVAARMVCDTPWGPVLRGQGGGDGGMFAGILARYLAQAAIGLADRTAAELVYASADAVWANRQPTATGPLFGAEWARNEPSGELSVALAAWMTLEAAAALERAGVPDPRGRAR